MRGVELIGWAAADNLFPVLKDLDVARCHAYHVRMGGLIHAITTGRLVILRALTWDGLAGGEKFVSNLMLEAFSRGRCPETEFLNFIDNTGFDQEELSNLSSSGLKACPKLREIRMDTTMKPHEQLGD